MGQIFSQIYSDSTGVLSQQRPYFYDDLRPEGAIGNQRFNNLSAKKYVLSYFYDGRDIVMEKDVSGNVNSYYIRGPGGEMLKEKRRYVNTAGPFTTKYYYYPDRAGNVYIITDDHGQILEKSTDGAFGERTAGNGISKFGISSNMYDSDTGLYYFAARWYDPRIGRFLEMDPVLSETGMMNMYEYCGSNPASVTDRWGESYNDLANEWHLDPDSPEFKKKFDEYCETQLMYDKRERESQKVKEDYTVGKHGAEEQETLSSVVDKALLKAGAGTTGDVVSEKVFVSKPATLAKLSSGIAAKAIGPIVTMWLADIEVQAIEKSNLSPEEKVYGKVVVLSVAFVESSVTILVPFSASFVSPAGEYLKHKLLDQTK
jgi:RHS repeat-associated protein